MEPMSAADQIQDKPDDKVRILALMGSGETAPTLIKTHREIISGFNNRPKISLLATPYRFQENVFELSNKIVDFFRISLWSDISTADLPEQENYNLNYDDLHVSLLDDFRYNQLVKESDIIFAGPGSPSYALSRWENSLTKDLLSEKLMYGGAVVFSSAAALTLGSYTLPVYEIYKVGSTPRWLKGLDVLSTVGINAAVIPHYNNAEGGTHDTRFCYMGERRLSFLEKSLPQDVFILGIDEHTCLLINLETSVVKITGIGNVTIRYRGNSYILECNTTLKLDNFFQIINDLKDNKRESVADITDIKLQLALDIPGCKDQDLAENKDILSKNSLSNFRKSFYDLEQEFAAGTKNRDAGRVLSVLILLLNLLLDHFSFLEIADRDDYQSELNKSKSRYIVLLQQLNIYIKQGFRDKHDLFSPLVENILLLRNEARNSHKYDEADYLRNILLVMGIQLEDISDGTTRWTFVSKEQTDS